MEPWVEALRGELLLRTGRVEDGRGSRNVVSALRRRAGAGRVVTGAVPPRDAGAKHGDAGDWDTAGFIAAQMLDHDASYGGSHLRPGAGPEA